MMVYIKHKIWQVHNADELYETSVSNTDTKAAARQSPNCIKKTKINQIWRKTIFNMADGIFTPCNVARSWHWFHQVTGLTAPCDVACGSGIVTVAVPCNVIRSSLMTCHWIRPNVRHIGILHLVLISTNHRSRDVILHQSPNFYPNWTTLGRKKWLSCQFSRWLISLAILDFRDPIMGSLKSPVT